MPGEGVWRLEERWGMAEGAEPSLLGEQLLVGHWVDGVRERKGGAARSKRESGLICSDFALLSQCRRKDEAEMVCVRKFGGLKRIQDSAVFRTGFPT